MMGGRYVATSFLFSAAASTEIYTRTFPLSLHGALPIFGEDVFKEVSVLSGGEKTRLRLCLFMNDQINTLFLDEPTNHLDMASRQWLEDSLEEFSETMLFVSHDRYFINRFATRIWQFENGNLIDFVGSYDEFVSFMEKRKETKKQEKI